VSGPPDSDGAHWTADAIRAGLRSGDLTPTEVIAQTYRRLEALDDPGATITVRPEADALAAAAALHGRSIDELPLFGVPFVVKDNIDVAGLPTTAACASYRRDPLSSATVVARLVAAGAIPVAKANLDQFATGLAGTRSPFGIPRNPVDAGFVPGGSSSGSAVVVASGVVPFALGTDTAGSGRVPASFTGLIGLKPTVGLLPTDGVVPAVAEFDCVSVFARTVADARIALQVMVGADVGPLGIPQPGAPPRRSDPYTIAVATASGLVDCDAGTRESYRAARDRLTTLGHRLVEVDVGPLLAMGRLLYAPGPWLRARYEAFGAHLEAHPDAGDPTVAAIARAGRGVEPATMAAARAGLETLLPAARAVLAAADVLALPVTPTMPTLVSALADPVGTSIRLGTFTNFVNLLGSSALSVPGPARALGLPAGLMLVGPPGGEADLLDLAASFSSPGDSLRPTAAAGPGAGVDLAVVGAHLAGLALNHQLTDRGATFVRATTTSADYRLVALPDSLPPAPGPARPGLIRVAGGRGGTVAVEVWRLTTEALGSFLTGIPAPLGLGTVRLRDGSGVLGFICEGIAAEGAPDITAFGGWRAWLADGAPLI
jgi:allophanate hydrolase